jgi:hypothetical protein
MIGAMAGGDDGDDKPGDLDEYVAWLSRRAGVRAYFGARQEYELAQRALSQQFLPFWNTVGEQLGAIEAQYLTRAGESLFMGSDPLPQPALKTYESFLEKTWRRNCVENEEFPQAPKGGWLLPRDASFYPLADDDKPDASRDWLQSVSDVVRARFVTKFLDGATFLADRVHELASEQGVALKAKPTRQSTFSGHYGVHLETVHRVSIGGEPRKMRVEIQVITQLTDVINRILHGYYEDLRQMAPAERDEWQWEYQSPAFAGNYLGHILHYIDGQVVNARLMARQRSE